MRSPDVRRFELTAVAFVCFNALLAVLTLREYRSLLRYCDDAPGPPGDCLEPQHFLWLEMLVGVWLLGGVALLVAGVVFYVAGRRRLAHSVPT